MKWLKDYFDLSKREQAGFVALLGIIAILFTLQFFMVCFVPEQKTDFSNLQKIAEHLQTGKMDSATTDSGENIIYPAAKKALTNPVDLNTADSVKLMTIKGIGPTFAGRILAFRSRLGCFVDVDQLQDVHGIGAAKYAYLKPQVCLSKGHPKCIHLNSATLDALMVSPYLGYKMANSILKYRTTRGRFTSVQDLKKVQEIDEKTFRKLMPYIVL